MSMNRHTFSRKLRLLMAQQIFHPQTALASLNAAVTALGGDATTYSTELQRAPAGLIPGQRTNHRFSNDLNLLINRGKAGNLLTATMASIIQSYVSALVPPANTTAPVVSGTGTVGSNLNTTNGVWTNSPTQYSYQWLRGGVPITGGINQTYALVGADSGTNCSCRVTARNTAGSANATSNAIAVA